MSDDHAGLFHALRSQILNLDPAAVGLAPDVTGRPVWGALLELGYPAGTATLVCLADGTTSLYTDGGFGVIGGGAHESVVAANRAFLATVEESLDEFAPESAAPVPLTHRATLRALCYGSRRSADAPQELLGRGQHPLSPVFHAGHEVISALRRIEGPASSTVDSAG